MTVLAICASLGWSKNPTFFGRMTRTRWTCVAIKKSVFFVIIYDIQKEQQLFCLVLIFLLRRIEFRTPDGHVLSISMEIHMKQGIIKLAQKTNKQTRQKWGRKGAQNLGFKTNIPDIPKASCIFEPLCAFFVNIFFFKANIVQVRFLHFSKPSNYRCLEN